MEPHTVDQQIAAAASNALKDAMITEPAQVNAILRYRKKSRSATLKWINDQVNDASGPPAADVIHATVSLMTHDAEKEVIAYKGYPQSPLATAQYTHVHGSVNVLVQDLAFFKKLVDLAGGPEALRTPQIRGIVQYADVLFATRVNSKPLWPFFCQLASVPMEQRETLDFLLGDSELSKLGTAFEELHLNPGLMQGLSKSCIMTMALHLYQHKLHGAPSLGCLVAFRCEAQHALLSSTAEGVWEELVRTAALLFSDMIFFVLPPGAGVRMRLVDQLKGLLVATEPDDDAAKRQAWIWSLMLGAAAAATLHDDDGWWPVTLGTQQILPVSVDGWQSMKTSVTPFLWWDYVLDAPAGEVWRQALRIPAKPG